MTLTPVPVRIVHFISDFQRILMLHELKAFKIIPCPWTQDIHKIENLTVWIVVMVK